MYIPCYTCMCEAALYIIMAPGYLGNEGYSHLLLDLIKEIILGGVYCWSSLQRRGSSGSPYNSGDIRSGEGVIGQPHSSQFPTGTSDQVMYKLDRKVIIFHCQSIGG